jgi:hypothetical protein
MYDMADVADVVDIGDRSLWSFDRSDCTGLSAILFINLTWLIFRRIFRASNGFYSNVGSL